MDEKEFRGVFPKRVFLFQALRAAFLGDMFNVCVFQNLEEYKYETFAKWVREWHCKKEIPADDLFRVKWYCVNYFLCPDADMDVDVAAAMEEVWPTVTASVTERPKRRWWQLRWG